MCVYRLRRLPTRAAELLDRSFEGHVPELQIYTYNRDGESSKLAAFGYNSISAR
jgi:hypothetical protein